MNLLVWLGIGTLGGAGAIARFLIDGAVASRAGREFPYGTLAVNLSGALTLGVLAGVTVGENAYRLLGIGLVGAYTTFSTWALESHRLAEDGRLSIGVVNFAVSTALGIALVWLGRQLGAAL